LLGCRTVDAASPVRSSSLEDDAQDEQDEEGEYEEEEAGHDEDEEEDGEDEDEQEEIGMSQLHDAPQSSQRSRVRRRRLPRNPYTPSEWENKRRAHVSRREEEDEGEDSDPPRRVRRQEGRSKANEDRVAKRGKGRK